MRVCSDVQPGDAPPCDIGMTLVIQLPDMGSSGPLFELHFDMVQRRVRHKHGGAQFQQHGRLNHLHVPHRWPMPLPRSRRNNINSAASLHLLS